MRILALFVRALLIATTCTFFTGCGSTESTDLAPSPGLESLSFGSPQTIDLLTWNIETFPKDEQRSPGYVVDILSVLQPDIVAVQEIWSLAHLEWVATTLGPYRVATVAGAEDTGLAFLYRGDTVTVTTPAQSILRNASYDFGNRPPIQLEVEVLGQRLKVINLHYKCCGDDVLGGDYWDEEVRRLRATGSLKHYLDRLPTEDSVVVMGDWNDRLTDPSANNVFQPLLDAPDFYRFTDLDLASDSNRTEWSFPTYPSHLDHILINRPLFPSLQADGAHTETLRIDAVLPNGLWEYVHYVSDHRPVGITLQVNALP